MFHVLMILMKFTFVPQNIFSNFFIQDQDQCYTIKFNNKKLYLYILKIPTKFDIVPWSFCQNQNPIQDQDHNFTLDFNTRTTFYT